MTTNNHNPYLKLPTATEPGLVITGDAHIFFDKFTYNECGEHPYVELTLSNKDGTKTILENMRIGGETAEAFCKYLV